jgi:CheY-like chemotaxis protein
MSGLRILVAEDLEDSVEILKLAFERAGVKAQAHYVSDGEETIKYLKGEEAFSNRSEHPLPAMLLLDLKMPGMDGFEVLEWLRFQPGLRQLLVVVFTSSEEQKDINRAFELGANSYIVKPVGFDKLQEIVRYLENYWLGLNQRPDCLPGKNGLATRVLLRDTKSGQYFLGNGKWTDDVKQALTFGRSERAVQAALGMEAETLEILVEVDQKRFNVQMRLAAESRP